MNEQELRDYFGAAALTGLLSNQGIAVRLLDDAMGDYVTPYLVKRAYDLADAMLKERKRDDH